MQSNPILLAIPAFLLLIAVEFLVSRYQKKKVYVFNDFVNNISAGVSEQLFSALTKLLTIFCYAFIANHFTLFIIDTSSVYQWVLLWLMVDFCYYWMHRAMHRCTFLWAGHSVHHQSEQYNLSVALRQGMIQSLFSWIFYLPLAILGYPVWMFAIVSSLNTLYQFWIHTTLIKKMGPLEWFLNTPSHHRVHHGTNKEYIDKNYAGSLIIWDKLFGTFEPEQAPVTYGVTEPLETWNPFYANIKVLMDVLYYGRALKNFKDKCLAFVMPPEWIVDKLGETQFYKLRRLRRPPQGASASFTTWVELLFAIALLADFLAHFQYHSLPYYGIALSLCISLYGLGEVLSMRKLHLSLNILRILSIIPICLLGSKLHLVFLCWIILVVVISKSYTFYNLARDNP